MHNEKKFIVSSFYKFVHLRDSRLIKTTLIKEFKNYDIKGTFIIGKEGINSSFSVRSNQFKKIKSVIRSLISEKIKFKNQHDSEHSFLRLKIKEKKEIITLGKQNLNPEKDSAEYINPNLWDEFIVDKDSVVIDTRNIYESEIGTFKNSLKTETRNFRDFPKWLEKNKNRLKNKKIGMFCTGGIRCEKASNYLIKKGFRNIFQLQGGIIEYLKTTRNKKKMWIGECFVFDERTSINDQLEKGSYSQCFACRSAITQKERKSKFFKFGISCPKCSGKKTNKQKKRYEERQKQMLLAKKKGIKHLGS